MVSSFFNKTKPINFLVLAGIIPFLFFAVTLKDYGLDLSLKQLLQQVLGAAALIFSIYVLGNMVKSGKLSSDNSFAILFFTMLLAVFSSVLMDIQIILSYLFLLVSWDRSLALRNEKRHKEKIFESALCILIASFFWDWSLLFLIPLYISISLFCGKELRLWLMPFAAFVAVGIISIAVSMLLDNTDFFGLYYRFELSLDFFLKPNYLIIGYIFLMFALVFVVFGKLGYRRLGRTLSLRLIFAYAITAVTLLFFSKSNDSENIIITFFPFAIFLANFVETIKSSRLKEAIIISGIVLPVLLFSIGLLQ